MQLSHRNKCILTSHTVKHNIKIKEQRHLRSGTKLIKTFSKFNDNRPLLEHLKELLENNGFVLKRRNELEIFNRIKETSKDSYFYSYIVLVMEFISQFKLKIPNELIALHPSENRDESRLLVLNTKTKTVEHRMFKDIIDYFEDKDVLALNDTKVFPARLYGNKEKTGAKIEVFLLRELNREQRLWDVLVDPARKISRAGW